MRSRKILLAVLFFLLVLFLFDQFGRRPFSGKSERKALTNELTRGKAVLPLTANQDASVESGVVKEDPRMREFRQKEETDPQWARKVPIEFYGKVVDEEAMPIGGVKVSMDWVDLSPNGSSSTIRITDSNGLFSLQEAHGRILALKLEKSGYYPTKDNTRSFDYAYFFMPNYHEPDQAKPVIFTMRKKGEIELLLYRNRIHYTPTDGTPVFLNFMTGNLSTNGQFDFQAWCPPIQETRNGPFEWRFKIGIKDGGLLGFDEEFPFLAPTNGYIESMEISMVPGSTDWNYTWGTNFFFYYGQPPKYGRMEFSTGGKGRGFAIQYWLNPSGSRNLEFDPHKQISQ